MREGDRAEILEDIDYAYSLFPRLKERRQQKVGTLSGGEELLRNPKVQEAYLGG